MNTPAPCGGEHLNTFFALRLDKQFHQNQEHIENKKAHDGCFEDKHFTIRGKTVQHFEVTLNHLKFFLKKAVPLLELKHGNAFFVQHIQHFFFPSGLRFFEESQRHNDVLFDGNDPFDELKYGLFADLPRLLANNQRE